MMCSKKALGYCWAPRVGFWPTRVLKYLCFDLPGFWPTRVLTYLGFDLPGFWSTQILNFPSFDIPGFWSTQVLTRCALLSTAGRRWAHLCYFKRTFWCYKVLHLGVVFKKFFKSLTEAPLSQVPPAIFPSSYSYGWGSFGQAPLTRLLWHRLLQLPVKVNTTGQ